MFDRHNVQNSLVVAAIAGEMGFDADVVRRALGGFKGVKRRFTITGEAGGITVVDDYGHHPVEISAVLSAARQAITGRDAARVIAVVQPHRWSEIHVAVNHEMPAGYPYGAGAAGDVFMPEERIDLPTGIRAFTMGSAYVNHLDDVTGSIEVGKLADLIVLDRDPFEAGPGSLAGTRVLLTLVDGQPVHRAPGL